MMYRSYTDWVRVVVVIDNNVYREDLYTAWGLSIYVETPNARILFDTDTDGSRLVHNAEKLGIDLSTLNAIVISHDHYDHSGGLSVVANFCRGKCVYVPAHSYLHDYVRNLGLTPAPVHSTVLIADGIYVVGELPSGALGLYEIALAIKMRSGKLVILCGCSHPGVERIVEKALRDVGGVPVAVIGGFHSPMPYSLDKLIELGVERIYPLHCSGLGAVRYLSRKYPEGLGIGGSGFVLYVE